MAIIKTVLQNTVLQDTTNNKISQNLKAALFEYFRFKKGLFCLTELQLAYRDIEDFIAFKMPYYGLLSINRKNLIYSVKPAKCNKEAKFINFNINTLLARITSELAQAKIELNKLQLRSKTPNLC